MTDPEIREAVVRALAAVAPEAEEQPLQPTVSFRDQLEIDSMDFVAFVLALEEDLGVRTPEVDYPRLSSLQGCLDYFAGKSSPR